MREAPELQNALPSGMADATLCFLVRGDPPEMVLLGLKQRGFGAGKWAGIGGRVEAGERVVDAACREVHEEIGVVVAAAQMQPRGVITFTFPHRPSWTQTVYLYVATEWRGEPAASEEMHPAWFALAAVPYGAMWDDARYWLARALAGERLDMVITFGADNATVVDVCEQMR